MNHRSQCAHAVTQSETAQEMDGNVTQVTRKDGTSPTSPGEPSDMGGESADLSSPEARLRRQHAYLSALHETALGLINRLDLSDLLEAIILRAGRLVGAEHGHIYLVDPQTDEIETKVAVGHGNHFLGMRLKRGEGLAGRVWATGEPLIVKDYDAWAGRSSQFPYSVLHGVVGMPLKSGSEVIGVMVLAYTNPGQAFGQDELELLGRFAQLASLALDNARLYSSLQTALAERKQAEQLERDRNRVLEMIAKGEPLSRILEQIALLIERQRPDTLCSILLLREGHLYHGAGPSLPSDYIQAVDGLAVGPSAGSCGTACFRGEIVVTEDIVTDPLWDGFRDIGLRHGLRACWSVPIFSSTEQVLGTFAMYSRLPSRPNAGDLELLETARRMASIAIEQHRLTDRLIHQAHHDPLTNLPNRILYEDRLQQALAHAEREGRFVALLLIDLDRFKRINDTFGHHVGDLLLKEVGRRLRSCARQNDTVARWGGDEFTMVLTDLETPGDAARVADRVLQVLRAPVCIEDHEFFITASIGISLFPSDAREPEELLRHADSAMYRAEEQGKNTYAFFSPQIAAAAAQRLKIETQLQRALERHEFALHYQPIVDLASGRVIGAEALIRWCPTGGEIIPAAEFISVAEESGLIVPIGAWALEEACRQARAWQRAGYCSWLRMAVNVSAMQFRRPDFSEVALRALRQAGLAAQFLELELTESLVMREIETSGRQLTSLRTLGLSIAIDDFGTGYSSLSYLPRLPVDILKIGRSFIRQIEGDPGVRQIIRAIVALARSLKIPVTAEGVETPDQLRFVRRLGCARAQGNFFGRPLPPEEFGRFLMRSRF